MIGGGVVILFIGMYFGYLVDMLMFVNLWNYGGFLLNGVGGLIVLLLVVIFVYGGIEVIGMSVGEVKDLECVILCVINVVFVCILLFYVLMMVVLMLISLWIGVGSDGSLFVQIFLVFGVKLVVMILNFVVISVVILVINSDIFGVGWMMFGMVWQGQVLCVLMMMLCYGVLWVMVFVMVGVLLVGVLFNYLMLKDVFLVVVVIVMFVIVWVWLMILLLQVVMCCCLLSVEVVVLKFKVLLWLVVLVLMIVFMGFVIVMFGWFDDMCVVLYVGVVWFVLFVVVFYVWICLKFVVVLC